MKKLFVPLFLFFTACGDHEPNPETMNLLKLDGTITIDDDFTPEEAEQVVQGFDMWRDATDGMVDIQIDVGPVEYGDPSTYARLVSTEDEIVPEIDKTLPEGTYIHGQHHGQWSMMVVVDRANIPSVVGHEIGHCLGLGHSENSEDMMAPYAARACVSQENLDGLCSVWDCMGYNMKPNCNR